MRLHAIVRGEVQMVGYRYFVLQQAQELDLTGWVRNGEDGRSVEVVAEGDESAMRQLEAALQEGPPLARVNGFESNWSEAVEGHERFMVRS